MLAACLIAAPAAAQDAPPATVAQYRAALQQAQAALAAEPDATGVRAARQALDAIHSVQLHSGETVTLAPLLGLSTETVPAAVAQQRVDTVLLQLQASSADNTAARLAQLQQVLARAEFSQSETWWDQLQRWLAQLWQQLQPTPGDSFAFQAGEAGQVVGWAVASVGALAVVLLLSYWLQGLLGSFVADSQARRSRSSGEEAATAQEARRRAGSQAQGGNYREAVRQLYLAALLTLEEQGLVVRNRSLTNRELLARVTANHPVKAPLQPVVDTFDDVWYGVHEPDEHTFQDYAEAVDAVAAAALKPAAEGK